ncbi:extracellular solute-binding protein [Kineococcus arenarius]|uniref:extracellular solute-binding protein n=1 Tax=unclassified Kineococcus TaxID=2621656 RepID=UPI003D7F0A5B
MSSAWRTRVGAVSAGVVLASCLSACGDGTGASGPPVLTWYTNPDAGGQAAIAERCTAAAGGAYTIETSILPRDAAAQREQLMRRLAGGDSSIDLMSLDPVFVPEAAEAGFLAPIPDDLQQSLTAGIAEGAVQGATWDDELVAAPFWANTQLLWYRESMVRAAGLDPAQAATWTWQQIIDAAAAQDSAIGVQGQRAESMTVWVNALIESAGGHIIENPDAPVDEISLGIDSPAGEAAAGVMQAITAAGVAGPGIDNRDEAATADLFEQGGLMFATNWPFVYAQAQQGAEQGTVDPAVFEDYAWTTYPRMSPEEPSAPPLGGIDVGVGAFSEHQQEALAAMECIVSPENQASYMISDGNPAAALEVYDLPEVREAYPMADVIRESLQTAAPRPQTAYYNEVSTGIQYTWQPVSAVSDETPETSEQFVLEVLRGERLL